ncbi:hypothetical protein HJD18_10205 [Thermoleophilia bacterium SCSIO 60948]|nr:hypothetical protein HJD18_10205 [Thermoleophilia bacterium SCSIO 60948]
MRGSGTRLTGFALSCAAVMAIVLSGDAVAGFNSEYEGSIRGQPPGRMGLDIEKRGGKRVIGRVLFDAPTDCESGESEISGGMSGFVQIRRGRFDAKRAGSNFADQAGDDEVTVSLAGRVVSKRVIRGTIRVKELRRNGMQADRCTTGKRRFRVEKVAG